MRALVLVLLLCGCGGWVTENDVAVATEMCAPHGGILEIRARHMVDVQIEATCRHHGASFTIPGKR